MSPPPIPERPRMPIGQTLSMLILSATVVGCGSEQNTSHHIQHQPFMVNATEQQLDEWLRISLAVEGYDETLGHHIHLGLCGDDGTRQKWNCPDVSVYENGTLIAAFNATCDTSMIDDIGQFTLGSICELETREQDNERKDETSN